MSGSVSTSSIIVFQWHGRPAHAFSSQDAWARRPCYVSSNAFRSGRFHRLELTALDEEVEEARMRLQPAVFDALYERFQLRALRLREQGDARALDGRVADLHDAVVRQVRDQADPLRRVDLQVPPETAGEVKHVDVVERDPVVADDGLQPRDVRALGLRQLVHVALEEEDVAGRVERDAR